MSKFSQLAGLDTTTHESGVIAQAEAQAEAQAAAEAAVVPVVEETPPTPPVYENPLDEMPVANGQEPPRPEEEVAAVTSPPIVDAFSPDDLKWMSKIKLEEIGRTLGIELDRRLSQPKLVKQLTEHIENTQ